VYNASAIFDSRSARKDNDTTSTPRETTIAATRK